MRSWIFMLGGMIVWTVHFFSLYAVASILGSSLLARVLTILITLACLFAAGTLLIRAFHAFECEQSDRVAKWIASLAGFTAAISVVAILWQGLPALLA